MVRSIVTHVQGKIQAKQYVKRAHYENQNKPETKMLKKKNYLENVTLLGKLVPYIVH